MTRVLGFVAAALAALERAPEKNNRRISHTSPDSDHRALKSDEQRRGRLANRGPSYRERATLPHWMHLGLLSPRRLGLGMSKPGPAGGFCGVPLPLATAGEGAGAGAEESLAALPLEAGDDAAIDPCFVRR
jgi:hypothetical protein